MRHSIATLGALLFTFALAGAGIVRAVEAGVNKVGPSLRGIMARAAASVDGFKYSDAMKNAQLTWTPDALDHYLTNPRKSVPGAKMAFPSLPKPEDRANVITYLEQAAGAAP